MDQIRQQVQRARRRLLLEQFLSVVGWSMFAGLLFGAIGLAIPKIWILPVDSATWMWSCIAGAVITGLVVAVLATLCAQRGMMDAAMELDRRFALKERVSTSLSLSPEEAETEIGRALLADTARRVATVDVRDAFHVRAPWTISLPLLPALGVFVLAMFVPDAASNNQAQARATTEQKVIKKETDKLKQQLKSKREQLSQEDLKEAEELLKQLEQAVDELQNNKDVDRKKALIKVNEMAKMVEQKRQQLAGSEEIRKQFEKLKNIEQGAGDKIAEALKQGNFEAAMNEVKKLQQQLAQGKLGEQEQKELGKQLAQMQQKLQEMKQSYDEAKSDLEQQIEEKKRQGDMQAVNDLQNKLDQLNQMNPQMSRLNEMAQKLGQCSQCLQNGDAAQASDQLNQLAKDLEQMQNELDQLQTLNEMLDQLSDVKGGLGGEMPLGDGEAGSDLAMGQGMSSMPGRGLGEGRGFGERPEDETDTQNYESKVASKLHRGPSVVTGVATGPNIAGDSREAVQEAILSSMQERVDPAIDDQLPRDQRDHAREYFKRFLPDP